MKYIVGNWKMNMTLVEIEKYFNEINKIFSHDSKNKNILCIPYTYLYITKQMLTNRIKIGAQNLSSEINGAFTGEISIDMLKDFNVEYVIIGHSERRKYFFETDKLINKKIKLCLEKDMKPILCIGDTWEERKNNLHKKVLENQLLNSINNISANSIKNIIIAYEPVWAIGSGRIPSYKDIYDITIFIKSIIKDKFRYEISVLYGGSVGISNYKEILNISKTDGLLIGKESLSANNFYKFTNY